MNSQPSDILAQARSLLGQDRAVLEGVWPRATAFLTRQALEAALSRFWRRFQPGVEKASFRSQLLCFPYFLGSGPELAYRASWVWQQLSRACHAHPYELAPGSLEIRQWIEDVETIVDEVERLAG